MTPGAPHFDIPELSDDEPLTLAALAQQVEEARQLPRELALQQTLQTALHLNRSSMTLLERQRALQNLADEFRRYSEAYQDRPTPPVLFARLATELAAGFKRLVLQLLHNRQPSRPHLAWCLYMAQLFHGHSLLQHYRLYQEPPGSIWRDSHRIYWLGERHGCLDEPIAVASLPRASASLRGLYQQCLLLALGNPFQLAEGESALLFAALAPIAEFARLLPWEEAEETEGPLIDLEAEQACLPPGQPPAGRKEMLRRLEPGPLLIALDDPAPLRTCEETEILRRIRGHWFGRDQRRHPRDEQAEACRLVVGLPAIHAQLLDKRPATCQARLLDKSPGGVRLLCPAEDGDQLPVGQLVLLLTGGATACLALVRWRHQNAQGLHVGLRYLEGTPKPAWLRRAPSSQTHPAILQSAPCAADAWRHDLWLAQGQFVECEALWLQLPNANSQTAVQLPPATLSSRSVSRHPLRLG